MRIFFFLFSFVFCIFLNVNAQIIIKAGTYQAFEIQGGRLWGWGSNYYGVLGTGDRTDRHSPTPVGSDYDWADVYAADVATVGKKTDGTLWSWGYNVFGELGQGTTEQYYQLTPKKIGNDNDWVTVAAGIHHFLAIKTNGTLWSWGMNDAGQLGQGNNTYLYAPTQVGTDKNW